MYTNLPMLPSKNGARHLWIRRVSHFRSKPGSLPRRVQSGSLPTPGTRRATLPPFGRDGRVPTPDYRDCLYTLRHLSIAGPRRFKPDHGGQQVDRPSPGSPGLKRFCPGFICCWATTTPTTNGSIWSRTYPKAGSRSPNETLWSHYESSLFDSGGHWRPEATQRFQPGGGAVGTVSEPIGLAESCLGLRKSATLAHRLVAHPNHNIGKGLVSDGRSADAGAIYRLELCTHTSFFAIHCLRRRRPPRSGEGFASCSPDSRHQGAVPAGREKPQGLHGADSIAQKGPLLWNKNRLDGSGSAMFG